MIHPTWPACPPPPTWGFLPLTLVIYKHVLEELMFQERKAASGADQDNFLAAESGASVCPPPLSPLRTDAQTGRTDKQSNDYVLFLAAKTL